MIEQGAVFIFDNFSQVNEAIRSLAREGFPIVQVSVVAWDPESENEAQDNVTSGEAAKRGAITGAGIGALFDLLADVASVWTPGLGPLLVAGLLAAVLLGGIEGATAGAADAGLLHTVVSRNGSEPYLLKYQEQLKNGKYVMIAHGSAKEVNQARHILRNTGAELGASSPS